MSTRGVLAMWLALGLAGQQTGPSAGPASAPAIRYVANSGMLVTLDGRRFLIDAPIRDGIAPYATSSADERAQLEAARAPYDSVDAVLVLGVADGLARDSLSTTGPDAEGISAQSTGQPDSRPRVTAPASWSRSSCSRTRARRPCSTG